MRKPILTDEVLEQARRKKRQQFGYYEPESDRERSPYEPTASFEEYEASLEDWDEFEDETYHGYREGETIRIPVESSIIKSRRIETVKKEAFGAKLNKILFWIVLLLILFLIAVYKL